MDMDFKTLIATSEPDFPSECTDYKGAPIGYAAKVIQHAAPGGAITTRITGNILAPRPIFFSPCNKQDCVACAMESMIRSQVEQSVGDEAGTGTATRADSFTSNVSPACSLKACSAKIESSDVEVEASTD